MGMNEDVTTREGLIASMQDVALKQFLFLRNLALPVSTRFGDQGVNVLEAAFREYGEWRGEGIRRAFAVIAHGHDALQLLRNWDACDFALANAVEPVTLRGRPSEASITLRSAPGTDYFESEGGGEVLQGYWSNVLAGIGLGFDPLLQIVCSDVDAKTHWTVTVKHGGLTATEGGADRIEPFIDVLALPERAVALIRQSSRTNGALYMFIARQVLRNFGATGEELIREGVRGIGRERGLALREKHLRAGKSLDLKNLMLDWDGPLVSTWVFRDSGYLSKGTWHQDCVYCPYADVWAEYGPEGLNLGYLYDVELHTTMYETYHPGTIVRWDSLKTRGDHLCKFRFSIPELLVPGDPTN
jgi:hypothetical protein